MSDWAVGELAGRGGVSKHSQKTQKHKYKQFLKCLISTNKNMIVYWYHNG